MKRFSFGLMALTMCALAASCGDDGSGGGNPNDSLPPIAKQLIAACGLACPGDEDGDGAVVKGVLDGNTSISGVASVDAFFASVNNFRSAADGVSAGIEAQLGLIRADFELGATGNLRTMLEAKVKANIEGELAIDYQPARCAVDARATFEANARCEATVTPGEASIECMGVCQLDASAKLECDAGAELQCTFTGPTVDCKGECTGTCEAKLEGSLACDGTCRGTCDGNCSAYSNKEGTQCAGSCSGKCTGSCEAKAEAQASCKGTCRGECKVSGPMADCKGSAHAECKATGEAKLMCKGKCEGKFEPPQASAECEANARAEAKLNVQCTPPQLNVNYRLKAGVDAMAQAKFEGALKTLIRVRLPALLQITARGNAVGEAGEELGLAAGAAVKASVDALRGDAGIRAKFGLGCALGELPEVKAALATSGDRLVDNLNDSAAVSAAFSLN